MSSKISNPLLESWTGPYGGIPALNNVPVKCFDEAFAISMREELAEIEQIANQPASVRLQALLFFVGCLKYMRIAFVSKLNRSARTHGPHSFARDDAVRHLFFDAKHARFSRSRVARGAVAFKAPRLDLAEQVSVRSNRSRAEQLGVAQ